MLLYGKPVIEKLLQETKARVSSHAPAHGYVAFLLASDDYASTVYVWKKQEYAARCGLWAILWTNPTASYDEVRWKIAERNEDPACLGIIVQLPLATHLKPYQAKILHAVDPCKDVDGLWGELFGLSLTSVVDFLPATPKATFELLDYYAVGDMKGKIVLMIGQSNLMWKPFVLEAMRRWATVITTNSSTSDEFLNMSCRSSDIIVSATGVVWLLTPELFAWSSLAGKIIVDVGYWIKDGKACGDADRKWLADLWAIITPVPGGVWPVTVACLFHNLLALHVIRLSWIFTR